MRAAADRLGTADAGRPSRPGGPKIRLLTWLSESKRRELGNFRATFYTIPLIPINLPPLPNVVIGSPACVISPNVKSGNVSLKSTFTIPVSLDAK